jgi:hypothetical protein
VILVAIAIPALTGYISKAEDKESNVSRDVHLDNLVPLTHKATAWPPGRAVDFTPCARRLPCAIITSVRSTIRLLEARKNKIGEGNMLRMKSKITPRGGGITV